MRTARSRTSGENLLVRAMPPSSQGMEPPGKPERFTFPAPALLTLSLVMFRARYGKDVARIGRLGLALAIFGMALVAVGQFGYACLGFARSGNYWIGPGILCVELGLLVFAVAAAHGHTLRRHMWMLPFLMAVLPLIVIATSQVVALLQGTRLLYMSDIYFQVLYVALAVLWIVLGVLLWFEGNALARSGGEVRGCDGG